MKKIFKIFALVAVSFFALQTVAMADSYKPIAYNKIPSEARQIISKHFPAKKVALSKMDSDFFDRSYDVIFTDGTKIEFDKKGNWKEIDCHRKAVPSALVPSAILRYVSSNYRGHKIVKIERDSKKYDVELSNGVELTFDKKFNITDIDN